MHSLIFIYLFMYFLYSYLLNDKFVIHCFFMQYNKYHWLWSQTHIRVHSPVILHDQTMGN